MFHHIRKHWRQFRPRANDDHDSSVTQYKARDVGMDAVHIQLPEPVVFVCDTTDFFDCAEQEVASLLQRRPEVTDLDRDISRLRKRFETSHLAHDGLVALLAQAPRASLAQIQMDAHPHGYRNKQERLYELIDFNDTFVATILELPDVERTRFAEATKLAADRICKRVGAPCFTNKQWEAIVRGLTREIAVYWAAKNSGFNVFLTSRAQDALGIDLQVQDPESKRYINIDVKTPSAFRYRLEELIKEDRMTPHEQLLSDERSYALVVNGHGGQKVAIVLLCILPDRFGDLAYFRFVDEAPMRTMLNGLIRDHGLSDGKFGLIVQ